MFRVRPSAALAAATLLSLGTAASAQTPDRPGVLLLAHGGQRAWNDRVISLSAAVNQQQPTETALGMASRPAIQAAIDRLVARQVTRIVAVPLFVSSHSSVVTSTEYLLGLRTEMPADLRIFARMNHAAHGAAHDTTADAAGGQDNTRSVESRVPIRMTPALNQHRIVAEILTDRARSVSADPAREAVILVAHGPVPDEDNARWLADMKVLADQMKTDASFASIDYLTVRDDAPAPIRSVAAEELRGLVSRRAAEDRRVLVVPLLLSYGGIEKGIQKRLEGLTYAMPDQGLMPDDRLISWVREMVATAGRGY